MSQGTLLFNPFVSVGSIDQELEEKVLRRLKKDDPGFTRVQLRFLFEPHVKKFVDSLAKNTHVTWLNLGGPGLTDKQCKVVGKFIADSKFVTYFAVTGCEFGLDGVKELTAVLKGNKNLKTFILGPFAKHPGLTDATADTLCAAMASHPSLTRFELIKFNLSNTGVKFVAGALVKNRVLKLVNLSENTFGEEGMNVLLKSLNENKTLKHLILDEIPFTPTTLNSFLGYLNRSGITRVSLSGTKAMTVTVANTIAEIVSVHKMLTQVSISGCNLGNEGAAIFFSLIAANGPLQRLDLADSNISRVNGSALEVNCTLTELDLSNNNLDHVVVRELMLALRSNFALQRMNIAGNRIADDMKKDFAQSAQKAEALSALTLSSEPGKGGEDHSALFNAREARRAERQRVKEAGLDKAEVKAFRSALVNDGALDLKLFPIENSATLQQLVMKAFDKASEVRSLHLGGCGFGKLPVDVLATLPSLTDLNMSFNRLTVLPPEISRLSSLVSLDLRCNQIVELPIELFQLTLLTSLRVQNNQLSSIPLKLFESTNLVDIHLGGNKVNPATAAVLAQFQNEKVNLSKLDLEALPSELFHHPKLLELYLNDNKLTVLPPEIGQLTTMVMLDIRNNKIDVLPWQLANCKALTKILLDGNPLARLPTEVRKMPTLSILQFLADLQKGSEPCYRIKLMLVGEENVGKTSLANVFKEMLTDKETLKALAEEKKMKQRAANSIERSKSKEGRHSSSTALQTVSTDGINVTDLEIPVNEKVTIKFHTWDFAGQEIYCNTHTFFLSRRSIYLVCFRLPEELEVSLRRVDYWLQLLQSKTEGAPVILVGTHRDTKKCTEEYVKTVHETLSKRYAGRFSTIRGFFAISCKSRKGVKKLIAAMRALAVDQPHMGEQLPSSYVLLEAQCLALGRRIPPIFTIEQFKSLAQRCGLDSGTVPTVLEFLHQIGTLVYFKGGTSRATGSLENWIVLNPQWLADVFKTLITFKHNFVQNGVLEKANLVHLWRPPQHTPELHELYLSILERFEIILSLKPLDQDVTKSDLVTRYLVAPLLPDAELSTADLVRLGWTDGVEHSWNDVLLSNTPTTMRSVGRVYSFHFLPIGLFSRLLVRVLGLATPVYYWRHGFFVRREQALGYVTSAVPDRRITLLAKGLDAASLLSLMTAALQNLLDIWFQSKPTLAVVCNCEKCHSKPHEAHNFPMADVQESATKADAKLVCPRGGAVSLDALAPDITLSDLKPLLIKIEDLQIESELGRGASAIVYKGVHKDKTVAIKKMYQTESMAAKLFTEFRAEARIMYRLRNPWLLQLIALSRLPAALVSEYCPHGTLHHFIHGTKDLSWEVRLRVASDVTKGVAFMHSFRPPVLHRDLKSHNALVVLPTVPENNDVAMVKVADFGLCVAAATYEGREVDNPLWLAPEIMLGREYSEKADVYSLGMVYFELAMVQDPFSEFSFSFMSALEDQIIEGLRPQLPPTVPEPFADLIRKCWNTDAKQRPHARDLVQMIDDVCVKVVNRSFASPLAIC